MARGLMDRLQVEDREPEQAKARAIVIDYDTAKWLFGIIVSCGIAVAGAAWYVATTVTDVERRVTVNTAEISGLKTQFGNLQGSITEGRVSDATLINSLAFIRDAVSGISNRLDRIENKVDAKP